MSGRVQRWVAVALVGFGVLVAGIYANEARKEVRILCGLFTPGSTLERVERILDTANLLHVTAEVSGGYRHLEISSWYNLRMSSCSVELVAEKVIRTSYQPIPW